jgi:DUF971 family protein
MNKVKPTGITADRNERVLKISWSDGHESAYPFAGLRAECPCAECKGGHEHMGQPPNPYTIRETPNEGLNIENVEVVGSYAIGIQWIDGHRAGIYTWEFLRQACPCLECAPPLSY